MFSHPPVGRIELTLQDRENNTRQVTSYFAWNMDAQAVMSAHGGLRAALGALSDGVITRVVIVYEFQNNEEAIAGNVREVLNVFVQSEAETIHILPIPSPKPELFEQEGAYRFIRLGEESKSQLETLLANIALTDPLGIPIGTTVLTGGMAE